MVRRWLITALVTTFLLIAAGRAHAQEPNFSLMLWSLGSAGSVQGDRYQVAMYVGIPFSGKVTGGSYTLHQGYPAAVANLQRRSGSLAFSGDPPVESEGVDKVVLTVQRTDGLDGQVTVDYRTENGTATAGSDYLATSGVLNFTDDDDTEKIVIPLINDTQPEPLESFTVVLENPGGGAVLGEASTAVVTILDDDEAADPPEDTPTPTPVPTAQPDTQPDTNPEDRLVFLPSIQHGEHPTAAAVATLYIINDMDGHLCYEIAGSILGNRCYDPGTHFYGYLAPDIYTWRITSSHCGTGQGQRELLPGENWHRFWCNTGGGQTATQTLHISVE